MAPPWAKTSCRDWAPAVQAVTLASIAEKSATQHRLPGLGIKAVRISSDRTIGTLS